VDRSTLKRWGIISGCIALVLCAAAAFAAWEYRDAWMPLVARSRDWAQAWLRHVDPLVFFVLMAIIPIVPVPMSLFYISTGIFPAPVAIAGILIAIPVNFAITYWLVMTLMRPLSEKLLAKAGMKIPQFSTRKNGILFSIFIRACGTPYTLQNYMIPLSGVKFRDYMIFGLPFQYIPAFAMMCLSDSILHGGVRKGIIAVAVLICAAIATKLATDYLRKKKDCVASEDGHKE
jgi:uncharacterized membrane protein YdjX (TVP38/TMEM64 family)